MKETVQLSTGSYAATTYDHFYTLTLSESSNVFLEASHVSNSAIYNSSMDFVSGLTENRPLYLEAGEYLIHVGYSSPTYGVLNTYIPSEFSFDSLTQLSEGSYEAASYDNFYSLTVDKSVYAFLIGGGDSAYTTVYDQNLNLITSAGIEPVYLNPGKYIVHASYSSPRNATINVSIHEAPNPSGDSDPDTHPTPDPSLEATPDFLQNVFDEQFYLTENPDVALAGIDPFTHFANYGWREGRDPNAFFETEWYLAVNEDVAAAQINPLVHYMNYGWKEGRDPSIYFDTSHYLDSHIDVALAGVNPMEHYLNWGIHEGREIASLT